MKIILSLLFAVVVGSAAAQPPAFDPWLRSETRPYIDNSRILVPSREQDVIHGARLSFDGIGVEVVRADNPLKLFDPFDQQTLDTACDNVVWDQNTGRAIGFNLFSIHW
jgi:hypothetical protein